MMQVNKNTPEAKCILKFIKERILDRLGCIILFTGETGRGKSFAGLRLLELWYREHFTEEFPTKHICENLEQAVLLVSKFNRKGEGILIEELSVLVGKRDSLTRENKLWNKFCDMCRIKQAVIIGNCPHISFIDSHFIMMCQIWVNCLEVNFEKNFVLARPLWLQTSPHKNEPYKHKFLSEDGWEIDYCIFKKIENQELLDFYNQSKLKSFEELSEEIVKRMMKNRLEKFKELGEKKIPRREAEAYELYLKGEHSQIAAERMGITLQTYRDTLSSAKKRLKMVEYEGNAMEIKENDKISKKIVENRIGEAVS